MVEAGILECRDLKWKKIRTIKTKRHSNSSLFGCVTYKINKTRQDKTGIVRIYVTLSRIAVIILAVEKQ